MSSELGSLAGLRFGPTAAGPVATTPSASIRVPLPVEGRERGPALGPLQFRTTASSPLVISRLDYESESRGWFDGLFGGAALAGGVATADEEWEAPTLSRREAVAGTASLLAVPVAAAGGARAETSLATLELRHNPGFDLALAPFFGNVLGDGSLKITAGGDVIDELTAEGPATIPAGARGPIRVGDADDGIVPDVDLPDPAAYTSAFVRDVDRWIDRQLADAGEWIDDQTGGIFD